MAVDLLSQLKKNPFVLAPMAGITDCAFRSYMKEMGCSIVISELVSATGLKYKSKKTVDLMRFDSSQSPVGIQIFGESLDDLDYAAKSVEAVGADFVDLNFGCPVPKVVKKGAGSAILKDLGKARAVFETVKAATSLPVTVKIRTGWDEASKNASELCHIAYEEGLTWVAIHGRTRAQSYRGFADWDYIKKVKEDSKIAVLGNGDICTAEQAVDKLNFSQCDGVMIGRGCLKNPWIFEDAMKAYFAREKTLPERNFLDLFDKINNYYSDLENERIQILQLKKLSSWYSAGLPQSSQFRSAIFSSTNYDQVFSNIQTYFSQYNSQSISSYNNEGFLMGGHG